MGGPRKAMLIALASVTALGVGAGVGVAAMGLINPVDTAGVIHSCFDSSSGRLRVAPPGLSCTNGETRLTWNQQGVKGTPARQGSRVTRGPKDPGATRAARRHGRRRRDRPGRRTGRQGGHGRHRAQGATGDTGPAGAAGTTGASGATGAQGPADGTVLASSSTRCQWRDEDADGRVPGALQLG